MSATTLNHYVDQANPRRDRWARGPDKQQGGRNVQRVAPYVFWLLLFVVSFTTTALAQIIPQDGGICEPEGNVVEYTDFSGSATRTVTCTCTGDGLGGAAYWVCE